ncbi:hypothetical protein HD597_004400 [Nonomuraea thailandensis]|uniref:DUF4760 domain-containing protein n=1 Tax=Nonomuraea thailandensis TaxID=1188745 RepID=A0A9X2GGS4_9ACTN|nr:hypothetical protein [Nonomuraea thailandensis]MCP2357380.1 hypothetical protein [Nonomuraea thailandensis]
MDSSLLLNLVALFVSVTAVAISGIFALRQIRTAEHANHIPVVIDLLTEFRSLKFNEDYYYVCNDLCAQHDPRLGISGLPEDAKEAVYSVAYYFQTFASLIAMRVVDKRATMTLLYRRVVQVWGALEPYVLREREIRGTEGAWLFRILESLAGEAKRMPADTLNDFLATAFKTPDARTSRRNGRARSMSRDDNEIREAKPLNVEATDLVDP